MTVPVGLERLYFVGLAAPARAAAARLLGPGAADRQVPAGRRSRDASRFERRRVAHRHPAPRVAARHGPRAPARRPRCSSDARAPAPTPRARAGGARMSGRLEGRVALISGGARGQGAAHGRRLAQEGAAVVLGDVLEAEGEAHAADAARRGPRRALPAPRRHLAGGLGRRPCATPRSASAASTCSSTTPASSASRRSPRRPTRAGTRRWPSTRPASSYGMRAAIPALRARRRRLDRQHRLDLRAGRRAGLRRLHRQQGRGDRDDQGRRARARRRPASASTRSAPAPCARR